MKNKKINLSMFPGLEKTQAKIPKPRKKKKVKKKGSPRDPIKAAYYNEVNRLTEEVKYLIPGIERRSKRGWHIDHKISKSYGFKNNIPAKDIAHISNLHMMKKRENVRKGASNIIDEHNSWIMEGRDNPFGDLFD